MHLMYIHVVINNYVVVCTCMLYILCSSVIMFCSQLQHRRTPLDIANEKKKSALVEYFQQGKYYFVFVHCFVT